MNFPFAIKLSSEFLQGSNIYKLWENDSEITFLSIALVWRGYHFTCHKGNNSYKKNVKKKAINLD